MKKPLFLLSSFLLCNLFLFPQGFYVEPYYSRSFALEKSDFVYKSNTIEVYFNDSVSERYSVNVYHYSLGTGNNYGLTAGYVFSKKIIGIELDFRYFKGKTLNFSSQDYLYFPQAPSYRVEFNYDYSLKSSFFSITPSLKLALSKNKWGFFLKTGLLIARCSIFYETNTWIYNTLPDYNYFEYYTAGVQYKPKWQTGIQGMIGGEYHLFDWLSFNVGLQYNSLGYRPESARVTEYKYRGEDKLDELTISEKEWIFSDSYSSKTNNNKNTPTIMDAVTYTFSNIAIHIGARFHIIKKRK
ncbi:MAG: hypothetical protein GXO86_06065 [Chlorobi bacterium]|nr:hypothetical protein [Chlorobiota bacterium]